MSRLLGGWLRSEEKEQEGSENEKGRVRGEGFRNKVEKGGTSSKRASC